MEKTTSLAKIIEDSTNLIIKSIKVIESEKISLSPTQLIWLKEMKEKYNV